MGVVDGYVRQFTGGNGLRRRAIERFAALGFPTGREEAWRFTDVTPIAETAFGPADGADLAPLEPFAHGPLAACQLAFVNGRFAPALSSALPPGVTRTEPDPADIGSGAFAALNTALFRDGAFLRIAGRIERPIHLLFLSAGDGFAAHPRVRIAADAGAQATIVESYLGPLGGAYLTNAVTEITLGDGAILDWTKVQRESPKAYHVATVAARQARASAFTSHSISLGAAIARNDISAVLDGEGAECTLNGLFEATGSQLVDHHTSIDHAKPHGTSRELYKGILNGKARGVFDGKIVVRPDAQKTNAMQTNRNLLLSKEALVNTKPQLEIFANDVKCRHGATIGQLDGDMLFYMRSRGIDAADARRLLVHAFASEIIDEVKVEAIRAQLGGCLNLLVLP